MPYPERDEGGVSQLPGMGAVGLAITEFHFLLLFTDRLQVCVGKYCLVCFCERSKRAREGDKIQWFDL